MLMKVGRMGQVTSLLVDVMPVSFTPNSLGPLILLDADLDATASLWRNAGNSWPSLYQDNFSDRPTVGAGVMEFDGGNDYMVGGYYNYSPIVAQTLPDGAGSDAGKGITCTGLALDDQTNTLWVSNHGQGKGGDPYTPSLMNVSPDGVTSINEIELLPLFPAIQSVQGVAVDTSDSTLWFVSKAENLLRHITKAGVDLGSFAVDTGANGLAYDGNDDTLLVLYDNGQVKRYNASNGTLSESVVTFDNIADVDHLFLDETNNVLWVSHGASGDTGYVRAYSIDNDVLSDPICLPLSDAIEGICFANDALYVTSDGYFHNWTLNQLHTYGFDPAYITNLVTNGYDEIEFNIVFKIGATSATTEAICSNGNPLVGRGFGFFLVGNTDDTIRLIINDGTAALDTVDVECSTALTSYSIITIKVDFSARSINIYQNGVLQGAGSYNAAIDNSVFYNPLSIGGLPNGTRPSHVDFKDICITDYVLSTSQNNNLGNYYADEHSLIWTEM